jgi:hypothetical protein
MKRAFAWCGVVVTLAGAMAGCGKSLPAVMTYSVGADDASTPDAGPVAHPADGGSPDDGAAEGGGGASSQGLDCPAPAALSVPADSPRVLILGPRSPDTTALAAHLQGMLSGDAAFRSPQVVGRAIDLPGEASSAFQGKSLMYYFYAPDPGGTRLAALHEPWTYVVLLEQTDFAVSYPEFYFEGARILGCHARAAGATPVVLMTWSADAQDVASRGAVAYRVANGTRSVIAPAGYAWASARAAAASLPGADLYVAAATLYATLTGRSAAATGYAPSGPAWSGWTASGAGSLAATAAQAVVTEAGNVHYTTPYAGIVQLLTAAPGGTLRFMSYGTSSEALWQSNMSALVPKAGFTASATTLSAPEGSPQCEAACLTAATPDLQQAQYDLMYARYYTIPASALRGVGPQSQLQVQVWDRHGDGLPPDGVEALAEMEVFSTSAYDQARTLGLAQTPYHLMFSKLKTMRPSVQLTSDGTHATPTVAYGQTTMSVVSRTGVSSSTAGLDPDTALASELGDQTIRQLSSLSVTGAFISDEPGARPKAHGPRPRD